MEEKKFLLFFKNSKNEGNPTKNRLKDRLHRFKIMKSSLPSSFKLARRKRDTLGYLDVSGKIYDLLATGILPNQVRNKLPRYSGQVMTSKKQIK
ncbi:hypothetical protein SAMN04488104_10923 [Algoriphagus faecimaris]|uniref:Uncharacterized protein n=1 Tax=Algoriphagus faecimaris TaxID=686796 RepID=A0A1G6YCP2_9BACT|nr:hypothetical protein SAMN04488104_10923 [Algoriphagus faecimaris]